MWCQSRYLGAAWVDAMSTCAAIRRGTSRDLVDVEDGVSATRRALTAGPRTYLVELGPVGVVQGGNVDLHHHVVLFA
jgi:hypothetical protein